MSPAKTGAFLLASVVDQEKRERVAPDRLEIAKAIERARRGDEPSFSEIDFADPAYKAAYRQSLDAVKTEGRRVLENAAHLLTVARLHGRPV